MKLTEQAKTATNKLQTRLKLALALKVSERWISKILETNPDDNLLTKAVAMKIIKKETGLRQSEILEASEVSPAKMAS